MRESSMVAMMNGESMLLEIEGEVGKLVDRLAGLLNVSRAEAIRVALEHELALVEKTLPLHEHLRPLQERIASWPKTGLQADKAFYDSLNDE